MVKLDDFEFRISNFQVSIFINANCTQPYIDQTNIYLPPIQLPDNATLHHVQDSICIELHSIGINFSYKLDKHGQLINFAFHRKIGCVEQLSKDGVSSKGKDGEASMGNDFWSYRLTTTKKTTITTSNDSFDFSVYQKKEVADVAKVEWICQTLEK